MKPAESASFGQAVMQAAQTEAAVEPVQTEAPAPETGTPDGGDLPEPVAPVMN